MHDSVFRTPYSVDPTYPDVELTEVTDSDKPSRRSCGAQRMRS